MQRKREREREKEREREREREKESDGSHFSASPFASYFTYKSSLDSQTCELGLVTPISAMVKEAGDQRRKIMS